jgi:hypothetical protein
MTRSSFAFGRTYNFAPVKVGGSSERIEQAAIHVAATSAIVPSMSAPLRAAE